MNFNQLELDPRLAVGIKRVGYQIPTPIQEAAIPPALAGYDLIGTAQTGTGKTAAFVLPILNRLMSGRLRQTRALIVTPTRELAEQIHQNIRELSTGTRVRSATIYGGVGAAPQIEALQSGVEILVACPGRLLDHIQNGHASLDRVEVLVLDEADRMLDMGFLPDVRRILKYVPKERQTMLFSATFPKEIEALAAETLHQPRRIKLGLSRPVHTVDHALYPVPRHLKRALLMALLKKTEIDSVLVFTRTKHRAQRLARQIAQEGYRATSLHGDRTQGQRQSALKGFKNGTYQIMVATDIAARGLDVEGISHVINYDMPDTSDAYIHRIGRTGRAEQTGDAFTFITSEDEELVSALEKIMGEPLPRKRLPDFDYATPLAQGQALNVQPPRPERKGSPKSTVPGRHSAHKLRQTPSNRRGRTQR